MSTFCWRRCYVLLALDCPVPIFHSILFNFARPDISRFIWLEYIEPIVRKFKSTQLIPERLPNHSWRQFDTHSESFYEVWLHHDSLFHTLSIHCVISPQSFRFNIQHCPCTEEDWFKSAERLINAANGIDQLESHLRSTGWSQERLRWTKNNFGLRFDRVDFLISQITVLDYRRGSVQTTEVKLDELQQCHLMVINKQSEST